MVRINFFLSFRDVSPSKTDNSFNEEEEKGFQSTTEFLSCSLVLK